MPRYEVNATALISCEIEADDEDSAWAILQEHVKGLRHPTQNKDITSFQFDCVEQDDITGLESDDDEDANE